MKRRSGSILRRLIGAVLLLEFLAAAAIVTAVALHEEHLQYKAFDASLRASSNALLGAVQEGEREEVRLDMRGVQLRPDALYRVTDESGHVLGQTGTPELPRSQPGTLQQVALNGKPYRFFTAQGERVFDPDKNGGIHHVLTVVLGAPVSHVQHEVWEAVSFVAWCTLGLLGITTLTLVLLIRQLLLPVRELAVAAESIHPRQWTFHSPESALGIVELQPLAAALERTIARLQRAFENQKRFTEDAAHELKTDVAIVKSSFQLLELKPRTGTEYKQGISAGLADLSRLESAVHRMLTLSRLERIGTDKSAVTRFDHAIKKAVAQTLPLAQTRGVEVSMSSLPALSVPLDAHDAETLCSNLIVNAVQHSAAHESITISLSTEQKTMLFSVRDRGEGVEENQTESIFEPFYRTDASRSRKTGGTGLGLTICRSICEAVGGSIRLENHALGGALVTVQLPVASEQADGQK